MKLKLGTRGSALARTQSGTIAAALERAGHSVELVIIKTAGDRSDAPAFGSIGAQGVFVREIEQALAAGDVDLAVHSFKDLPTRSPDALTIAAVPAREDPTDVLVADPAALVDTPDGFLPLRDGARVGTASARRQAWLAHFRPDLAVEPLRGNVPTRIGRLRERRFDAIVLAAAGIERLRAAGELEQALAGLAVLRLDPERFVPAPAQGALAVQCRRADAAVLAALAPLDDAATRAAVTAERAALARAEGGCDVAFGAHCTAHLGGYRLSVMLEGGGRVLAATADGAVAESLVDPLWAKLEELRP